MEDAAGSLLTLGAAPCGGNSSGGNATTKAPPRARRARPSPFSNGDGGSGDGSGGSGDAGHPQQLNEDPSLALPPTTTAAAAAAQTTQAQAPGKDEKADPMWLQQVRAA